MSKFFLTLLPILILPLYVLAADTKATDNDITSQEVILKREMAPVAAGEEAPMAASATESTLAEEKSMPETGSATPAPTKLKIYAGPKAHTGKLAESEIPVFSALKTNKSSGAGSSSRMIMGLAVIFVMSIGLIYFSRWYSQRNRKSADPNKIRMVSQHFLGPRKSIAIVRVAGESMLIGITDHNISMIKSLAMLDEEEAETGVSSFKNTLMDSNRNPDRIEEDFVTQSVVDRVSKTIKGMRSLS